MARSSGTYHSTGIRSSYAHQIEVAGFKLDMTQPRPPSAQRTMSPATKVNSLWI